MKTISVVSPANIAFIKYWGQIDKALVLPYNDSFSMNLSHCTTKIEMDILDDTSIQEMQIKLFGMDEFTQATPAQLEKVTSFYHTAKKYLQAYADFGFRIRSQNSFPMKAGIASSASFFSALARAFVEGFQTNTDTRSLSILARLSGSGSASRSVADGFVWWYKGMDSASSYAESIAIPEYWDLVDLVIVVSKEEKKTGSQAGHAGAVTSPYFQSRQNDVVAVSHQIKDAFMQKDFTRFGTLVEQEALNFSSILMTQQPPLFYWNEHTVTCMKKVQDLRLEGVESYFTIDAGANLHVICLKASEQKVKNCFQSLDGVETIISNYPSKGARLL